MFSLYDLVLIRDRAISVFNTYPARCRLKGMTRDLTEDEKRTMAFYEASLVTSRSFQSTLMPEPFEFLHEIPDGGACVHSV